jgi:hypothetical protein
MGHSKTQISHIKGTIKLSAVIGLTLRTLNKIQLCIKRESRGQFGKGQLMELQLLLRLSMITLEILLESMVSYSQDD